MPGNFPGGPPASASSIGNSASVAAHRQQLNRTPAGPLLWLVRGRGTGHARACLAISQAISQTTLQTTLQTTAQAIPPYAPLPMLFVSYGSGAQHLRAAGLTDITTEYENSALANLPSPGQPLLVDLQLPDQPNQFAVAAALPKLLATFRPRLLVSHEEFDAPAAAQLRGLPCLFLTDWFTSPDDWFMRSLALAQELLFLDEPGHFPEPPSLAGKVRYLGPLLRPFAPAPGITADPAAARRLFGVPPSALLVTLFIRPGRRTEQVAPLLALLQQALRLLPNAHLLDDPDDWASAMAASDLALTKGNRDLVLELLRANLPTVTISHGLNPIDDQRIRHLPNHRLLSAHGLTPQHLAHQLRELWQSPRPPSPLPPAILSNSALSTCALAAAERICHWWHATASGNSET